MFNAIGSSLQLTIAKKSLGVEAACRGSSFGYKSPMPHQIALVLKKISFAKKIEGYENI